MAGDRDGRAAVGDVLFEFFSDEHRVERNDDRVGAQNRVIRDRELRRVLHEQYDPVAAPYARAVFEPAGEGFDLARDPRKGERRVVVDDRRLVGKAPRRDEQVVGDIRDRDRDLVWPPLGPVSVVPRVHPAIASVRTP